ncbi:MAG: C40 family peptidase [Ignavibacteriaceae bacterium]|nr:C40 family peptidase [Ignavibacteriaceae bacterium]
MRSFILTILLSAGVLIYSGCSVSSTNERYGSTGKQEHGDSNSGRYANGNQNLPEVNDELSDFEEFEDYDLPYDETTRYDEIVNDAILGESNATELTLREKLMIEIIRCLNVPYKWGGNTREEGLDCSGFTVLMYKTVLNHSLYRTARDQFKQGEVVEGLENLKFGDLVFFDTRRGARPGHVGIYLFNRLFAHASTKQGIIISSFDTKYYTDKYMGARRFQYFETGN